VEPDTVSIDVTAQTPETVPLPVPGVTNITPSPEVAKQRTQKVQMGLKDIINKPADEVYQDFLDGKEEQLRNEAATAVDYNNTMGRYKAIQDAATAGPLSSEKVSQIMDPFNPKNQPADPDSVIERAYAQNYISSANTAAGWMYDNGLLKTATEQSPQDVSSAFGNAEDLLTKNQYILKTVQDLQQGLAQNQSTIGWLADQAKELFQPYLEYKQRGLIDDKNFAGGLLGSNLAEQSSALYHKPFPEFKQAFDAAIQYLSKDNPSLAVQFAQSMLGKNTFEKTLDNIFTVAMVPDAATGVVGAVKGGKAILAARQVRKAARDIVESAATNPSAGPAAAADGAGAAVEAAIQKASDHVSASIEGHSDPLGLLRETLTSTWKDMADQFSQNQGSYLSREAFTRIMDGFSRDSEDLLNKIETISRVERQPRSVVVPEVIRAYKDKIAQDFKGPPASLADIEGPIHEPLSNTYWYKLKHVNYDGEQFANSDTAKGFADQLGLKDVVIQGTEGDKLYLPEAALKHLESIQTTDKGTKFFITHGVEVESSPKPEAGKVPYNLKTQRFEPTLSAETAKIEQQGFGFHIVKWIPMNENDPVLQNLMIKTGSGELVPEASSKASLMNSASVTDSLKNGLFGWLRNSENTLSIQESAQRKAATYARNNLQQWADGLGKSLSDIAKGKVDFDSVTGERISHLIRSPRNLFGKLKTKTVVEQFERTLDYARKANDGLGEWLHNPGELQDFYQRNFQRDPTYLETQAYFNYQKMIEGQRTMGEIAEFRNRAIQGYEQHQISIPNGDGTTSKSGFFDGRALKQFPGGSDYILVMGDQKGGESIYKLGRINSKMRDRLAGMVERGEGKVIELYDIDHHPLKGFTDLVQDQRIRYVFTKNSESKALSFNHVNRREGGHFEWDYNDYLKQADVRPQMAGGKSVENIYTGDTTIMPVKNRKLGGDVAKIWNEAHELIKQNRWEEVKPLAAKLGIDWQKFTGWYHPGRDEKGNPTRPRLNPHELVVVVSKDRKIIDIDNALKERYRINGVDTFTDGTKTGSANNFKVAYNTERRTFDFRTINDVGTKDNPVYQYQPAELIDPISTLNRSMTRVINSFFMDDMKLYSVQHWLRAAEPYLEAKGGINEIRSSPFWHFHNPEFKKDMDPAVKQALLSDRYKIQTFIGTPSKFDVQLHSLTQKLVDAAYGAYGAEEGRTLGQKVKSAIIYPSWMFARLKDPVDVIRGLTYHAKLGLFAIPQFLVQSQTHALIWALEPQHGTAGTYAMMLHTWSRFNKSEAMINALDNYATKLSGFGSRFRPGEWKEAMTELEKTGFEHVAGEYANLDNQLKTGFLQNNGNTFLRWGQIPFKEGERSTRLTAWYTAFREFREANPTTPITNIERNKILQKADLLTVNMSRASSSLLNHGVFSLSTQFLSYQVKLAELFMSKRITPMARARILTFYTALYGLPSAIGVTGLPVSDYIRTQFEDNGGYIPGEKWLSTMVNEGLPAWSMAMITGRGDLQKGNVYNVGDRFGSQGFQQIKQFLRSDIPWWQALGGAGISTATNLLSAAIDPFTQYALSWARGDQEPFRIKAADLVEPLKQISSISTGAKWWTAIQTGKWMSNNEQYVTDVNPLNATFMALTGLSPQEQDDMFLKNQLISGETEAQKAALKEFIKDWRRGIQAKENGDDEGGNAYHRNAMARLTAVGYPQEKIMSAIGIANKGYEKAIDAVNERMWKQGDQSKQQQRLDQYKRQLHLQDKREE